MRSPHFKPIAVPASYVPGLLSRFYRAPRGLLVPVDLGHVGLLATNTSAALGRVMLGIGEAIATAPRVHLHRLESPERAGHVELVTYEPGSGFVHLQESQQRFRHTVPGGRFWKWETRAARFTLGWRFQEPSLKRRWPDGRESLSPFAFVLREAVGFDGRPIYRKVATRATFPPHGFLAGEMLTHATGFGVFLGWIQAALREHAAEYGSSFMVYFNGSEAFEVSCEGAGLVFCEENGRQAYRSKQNEKGELGLPAKLRWAQNAVAFSEMKIGELFTSGVRLMLKIDAHTGPAGADYELGVVQSLAMDSTPWFERLWSAAVEAAAQLEKYFYAGRQAEVPMERVVEIPWEGSPRTLLSPVEP